MLGVVYPQTEISPNPDAARDFAQGIEALGFDYMMVYEHVLGANPDREGGWRGPYTHEDSFHEPFTLFSYLAGLTQTLEFVTGILILPQRQTALVAKQAAQVDLFSGGRLRLGVGVGWNRIEYEALGEDFSARGQRIEEQITVLRRLWGEELVDFAGDFHTIPDAGIHPRPTRQPIPIWIGGSADVVLRRAAHRADGWIPPSMPLDRAEAMVGTLHGYLAEAGRSPANFGMDVRLSITDEAWPDKMRGWQQLGATHFAVNTMGAGLTTVEEHVDAAREFIQHITEEEER